MIRAGESVRTVLLLLTLVASSVADARDTEPRAGDIAPPVAVDDAYLKQNDAAMAKMMAGMAVQPTGDVDRDFVAMMVPHHQGAIDMAMAVLRYGSDEKIRRLAQEIIVTQQQEIAAMLLAVGEPLPLSVPSPTHPAPPAMSSNAHRY